MTELRCPNCGKINPDILDVCQFCQTPLKPEGVLRIGDSPTKKNTGELESVLPDWLRDVRQQARDSAEEEAAQAAAYSKDQRNEPPDLLAGLASQASSADDEEVPDWLANLSSTTQPKSLDQDKPAAPSTPAQETDFFAQFNQSEPKPAEEDFPGLTRDIVDQTPSYQDKDELSDWFAQASEQPEEVVELDSDIHDGAWGSNFDAPLPTRQESAPKEEEDLSWLHHLEEAAKQTGDLKGPQKQIDWTANFETPSTASSSQQDLSWLDSLGGIEESLQQPSSEAPTSSQNDLSWLDQFGGVQGGQSRDVTPEKPSSQEDLSWLNSFGSVPEASEPSSAFPPQESVDAAPDKPISSPPFAAEDLEWLNRLGTASESSQASDVQQEKPSASEDLSWLNNLDKTSSQALPQEDLSWLKDLGGGPEPLATPPFAESMPEDKPPRQTAPLGNQDAAEQVEPDWLKSATEAPSMPAPGDVSMDWFSQQEQPFGTSPSTRTSQDEPAEENPVPSASTPQSSPFSDFFSTPSEPVPLSNQDVDSLFSVEMPDWLSQPEPTTGELATPQVETSSTESQESLAPVDLPSWVQAMRPVEAVISETASRAEDQPEEKEGPLAGLRGVIPGAPTGSSRRPKALSLKLQVTDEQQAGAALLEQILGSETSPRTLATPSLIGSQQVLRWALTGLFLMILSAVILLRSQNMPVPATLPVDASSISNTLLSIPADAKILTVIDYEPSLAGELEASGGPLLYQMVTLSHPRLSFVSTSPNGTALVERLVRSAGINLTGDQYLNLGFLPGGSAGVLGFVERPGETISASGVGSFAEYAAVIVLTDHAESGRVWVEQLQSRKQVDPRLAGQKLMVIASAQAGPLLQPYASAGQIDGMISGLSDATRYESANNIPPGITRSYWDAFGVGLMMAIALIIVGSLWSVFIGMRARRAEVQQG